jgi:hypothetical protein
LQNQNSLNRINKFVKKRKAKRKGANKIYEQICKIAEKWCKKVLMGSGEITLPGKKALLSGKYEIIQIDATETPTERP